MVLRKVALTGASGMVGRHVIKILARRGIVCMASSRRKPVFLPPQSAWTAWDLSRWKMDQELDEIFPGVQALLHIGAYVPKLREDHDDLQSLFDVNVRSCLCLAKWATKRYIPFLYLSGATVYANTEKRDIKESDEKTQGGFGRFYGYCKLISEKTLQYFVKDGLKLSLLRPTSIYGFGLPEGKMITKFLQCAARNGTIELQPPVGNKINLIHALDVAIAAVQVLENEAWGTFNIAGESAHSILDIAKTCVEVVGKGQIKILKTEKIEKSIMRFDLNSNAARRAFGFSETLNFQEGIRKMWLDMNE